MTAIAADLHVSPSAVSHVVAGRWQSARVARRIADVIGREPGAIWPGKYTKPGRRAQGAAK